MWVFLLKIEAFPSKIIKLVTEKKEILSNISKALADSQMCLS